MSNQLALQIPKSFHPTLIGHGGSTIRQLQASHGCDIHIPARDSPSNAVLLTGSPQSIDSAHRAIDQLLGFRTSAQPLTTASFTLSSRYYGQVIGPGGQQLRSIEGETGCSISLPRTGSSSEVVSVQGDRASVDKALGRIQQLTGQPINPSFASGGTEPQPLPIYNQPSAANQPQTGNSRSGSLSWQSNDGSTRIGSLLSSVTSLIKDQLHIGDDHSSSSTSAPTSTPSYQPGPPQRQPSFSLPQVDLSSAEINEVLFFPTDPSISPSSFDRFLQYVRSARHTIDSAIYTISDDRISRSLMTLHEQGVRVRLLTEKDTMGDQGSDVQALANSGCEVRYDDSVSLMHHKFLIVDGRLLLNGSFNFTRSATEGNQENVVVTTNAPLVQQFARHFEQRLWPTGISLRPHA